MHLNKYLSIPCVCPRLPLNITVFILSMWFLVYQFYKFYLLMIVSKQQNFELPIIVECKEEA